MDTSEPAASQANNTNPQLPERLSARPYRKKFKCNKYSYWYLLLEIFNNLVYTRRCEYTRTNHDSNNNAKPVLINIKISNNSSKYDQDKRNNTQKFNFLFSPVFVSLILDELSSSSCGIRVGIELTILKLWKLWSCNVFGVIKYYKSLFIILYDIIIFICIPIGGIYNTLTT